MAERLRSMGLTRRPSYFAREATLDDLDALTSIQDARDLHERRLRPGGASYHPENRVFLVERAGEAVGYVHAVFVRPPGTPGCGDRSGLPFLQSFIIKEGNRRRGAGTFLFQYVAEAIRERGYRSVYLTVEIDNLGALRLYERLGFRRTNRPVKPTSSEEGDVPAIELVEHFTEDKCRNR